VTYLPSDARVTPLEVPKLGDEWAGFRISPGSDEDVYAFPFDHLTWRRGRLVLNLSLDAATAEEMESEKSSWLELARRADAHVASLPVPPATIAAPAAFLPGNARLLQMYESLIDRLPADDAYPDFEPLKGLDTVTNAELLNDASKNARAPMSDPARLESRLLSSERRLLGLRKEYETVAAAARPADSRFPSFIVAHTVYADADGARQAFAAPLEEIELRVLEEASLPVVRLAPTAPLVTLGEQTSAYRMAYSFPNGIEVELYVLRWRRGAVELSALLQSAAGHDLSALLRKIAQEHDARLVANPLVVPAPAAAPGAVPGGAPAAPAPVQVPR
jgi:hypothetical protein